MSLLAWLRRSHEPEMGWTASTLALLATLLNVAMWALVLWLLFSLLFTDNTGCTFCIGDDCDKAFKLLLEGGSQ